ncbi:MAG: mechanosensitive ion channel family protein [Acidobacteria bacterium]|nr:mechanosensitive ion channel family protein [Acidobacteriota bacterium]
MSSPKCFAAGLLLVVIGIGIPALSAQEGGERPGESGPDARPRINMASVEVDGRALFKIRGVSALPAEKRAEQIADTIRSVARDKAFDPEKLLVVDAQNMTHLMAGPVRVVTIFDADGRIEDVSRHALIQVVLRRIKRAIVDYRAEREPGAIWKSALSAAGITLLCAVVVFCLVWLKRRILHDLAVRIEERVRSMGMEALKEGGTERFGAILRRGMRSVFTVLIGVTVFVNVHLVLGLFPWTRPAYARLSDWVISPLNLMGKSLLDQVPNLIFLLLLFFVLRGALGLIRLFFDSIARGALHLSAFEPEWALPTYKIVRLVVVAFGLIVAYPYIPGSDSAAFKGVSLFIGVVFSLGSSSVISNLLAGYTLTYRKAFKIGDRVKIGDVVGDVTSSRLQVTHVRSLKNEEVIIPNSSILNGEVVNYSSLAQSHGLILHTTVGIGYETPWRQVEAMLRLAAERTPELLREPAPFVLYKALGDFSVVYELNVYCDKPQDMSRLYALLNRSILDVFNEYGVQIMTPAYEGDPAEPKVVPKEEWFKCPAAPAGPAKP